MQNVTFESLENFRDLACHPCAYGEMQQGVIYRGASPFHGSEKDLETLRALGIRTIIDLRGARLQAKMPHPLAGDPNITVIPMDVPNGENFPPTEEDVCPNYLSFLADPYFMRRFIHTVVNCPKPMMIHCEAGKDRTGTMCLLIEMANGVSREDLCVDYNKSYDGRLAATEKRTYETYENVPHFVFHMNPKTIEGLIDLFYERYGSMEDYFDAMGVAEDEADAFCNLFGVQEQSAGAVVFFKDKVLVEHMQLGHYSMPKGHVEKSDGSLQATAMREIFEETGLKAELIGDFETYSVYSPKPGHIKRVTWFVATVDSDDAKPQPEEVERVLFLSPSDAMRVLTHDDDRRVLGEACRFFYSQSGK